MDDALDTGELKPTKKAVSKKASNKKTAKTKASKKKVAKTPEKPKAKKSPPAEYPRHSVDKALRIPSAILGQNAGKECSVKDAAGFIGLGATGPFQVEVSSSSKYGFLERSSPGNIVPTDLAKQVLRPQSPSDRLNAIRKAVVNAPIISAVYNHYRGENIPDTEFFNNALTDKFNIAAEKVGEFSDVFLSSLRAAELIVDHDGKQRVVDVSHDASDKTEKSDTLKQLKKAVSVSASDTCFVMMPFAVPLGGYYEQIYKPAIEKAGLRPLRADTEIFGTGKIIDQIWSGINSAKVLVAELTTRNPNVFYELGLAHALEKPVVLVSSNENDVPFDLKHIRVIYYDVTDPFWGNKLLDKVAENILSAIENPEEAVLKRLP